jgi:hypothetical protein
MNAAAAIASITDSSGAVRPGFQLAVTSAWEAGNNAGDGFEPDFAMPREPGPHSDELILVLRGARIIAVGWSDGSWAVDVTDALVD